MTRAPTAAPWWDETGFGDGDARRLPAHGFRRGGVCPTADRAGKPPSFRGETAAPLPALVLVLAVAGLVFLSAESPGGEAGPATPAPGAESRTWTDSSGKYHVEATFRGLEEGKARLEKSDGTIVDIPLEKLCEADQAYVRTLLSAEPAPQAPAGDEGRVEAPQPAPPETMDDQGVSPAPETTPEADSPAADVEAVPEPGEAAVAAEEMAVGPEADPGVPGQSPEGPTAEEAPSESSPAESVSPNGSDADAAESTTAAEPAAESAQPGQDVEQTTDDGSSALPRNAILGVAGGGGVLVLLAIGWWIAGKRRSPRAVSAAHQSVVPSAPVATPSAAPSRPTSGGLVQRARSVLAYGQMDEKRLASEESYRSSKLREFSEIIDVAKDSCRQAGRHECVSDLDTIMGLGTILFLAWGELRPKLNAVPMGLFAYSVMVIGCWTTPQSAIRMFALHEAKPGDTEEVTAKLVTTTASSLKQMMAKLGLG